MLIVIAVLAHAAIPRYQVVGFGEGFVRLDRWTGRVEMPGNNGDEPATWVPILRRR